MTNREEMIMFTGSSRIENCQISRTSLGYEDVGVMTLMITVKGDGWGCGFGGYRMDGANGMACVKDILETLKVGTYEELKGQYVRVITEGIGGRCLAIGHLIEDRWFSFKQFFGT